MLKIILIMNFVSLILIINKNKAPIATIPSIIKPLSNIIGAGDIKEKGGGCSN